MQNHSSSSGWKIKFDHVCKTVRYGGKIVTILNNVSGSVDCGVLMAIMGLSGSGKTSLIKILAGRDRCGVFGSITLNGICYQPNFRRKIAFVPQEDVFLPFLTLTVKDLLIFHGWLRLPSQCSKSVVLESVQAVLHQLRMEYCQDTPLLRLSGGERRRVTIGCQLISSPKLLFMDEGTSGLDSAAASALLQLMRDLCRSNIGVSLTIHQPSSEAFYSFDKVLVLSEGCVVYCGPPSVLLSYFSRLGYSPPTPAYNPADFVMEILSSNAVDPVFGTWPRYRLIGNWYTAGLSDSLDVENMPGLSLNNAVSGTGAMVPDGEGIEMKLLPRNSPQSESKLRDECVDNDDICSPMLLESNEGFKVNSDFGEVKTETKETHFPGSKKDAFVQLPSTLDGAYSSHKNFSFDNVHRVTTCGRQFWALLIRCLKTDLPRQFRPVNVFTSIAVAILSGLCWFQTPPTESHVLDIAGYLFFVNAYWFFAGFFTGLLEFFPEKVNLRRERDDGLFRLSVFLASKTVCSIPGHVVFPLLFVAISYPMALQGISPLGFLAFVGVIVLTSWTGESAGWFIGAAVEDIDVAVSIGTVVSLGMLILGGFYLRTLPVWLSWFRYLSVFRYTYDASLIIHFHYTRTILCDSNGYVIRTCAVSHAISADQVIDWLGVSVDDLSLNVGVILTYLFGLRLLTYSTMRATDFFNGRKYSTVTS